jgi:hypothetical protein
MSAQLARRRDNERHEGATEVGRYLWIGPAERALGPAADRQEVLEVVWPDGRLTHLGDPVGLAEDREILAVLASERRKGAGGGACGRQSTADDGVRTAGEKAPEQRRTQLSPISCVLSILRANGERRSVPARALVRRQRARHQGAHLYSQRQKPKAFSPSQPDRFWSSAASCVA